MDAQLIARYRFHKEHAGYIVGRVAEGALALARAEALLEDAQDADVAELVWDWDEVGLDWIGGEEEDRIAANIEAGNAEGPYYCAVKVRGECVASLGGIVLSTCVLARDSYWPNGVRRDPYARVVEAELAHEAEADLREALTGDPAFLDMLAL